MNVAAMTSAKTVHASNLRTSRLLRYVGTCCTNRNRASRFRRNLQGVAAMKLRPSMVATFAIASAIVFGPVCWSDAAASSRPGALPTDPASERGPNLSKVADGAVLPSPPSHHHTSQNYKHARHNNTPHQQYYQPARQYYAWHVH
jgi:hypothetical protein